MTVTINGTSGITTPGVNSTGSNVLGDNVADTLNVGNGAIVTDSSGNVGIGTSSPAQKLHVASAGTTALQVQNTASTGAAYVKSTNTATTCNFGVDGTGGYVETLGAYSTLFYTNGSERMRIDSSGNLLVGKTGQNHHWIYKDITGNWALTVENPNATAYGLNVYLSGNPNNTTQEGFRVEDSLAIRMRVYSNGNVQNVNNSYGATSDERIKENIVDATPKLKDLCKIQVRNYNLKDDENKVKQIGVVAQELETVFPNLVEEDSDGIKGVKYSVFVPMLIKAIQELKAELDATKAEVAALKGAA